MPSVSERQHNAMEAAAHGHSTLGIPKKVGEEFTRADDAAKPIAAGVIFVAPDGDVLLLRRAKDEKNYGGHWGLPGGGGNEGETAEDTARRETKEETAFDIDMGSVLKLVDRVETPNGMLFSTYAVPVDKKFVPSLDDGEHIGYCWSALDQLPRPIHPQVERVLGEHLGATADMSPEDWEGLRSGFVKWTREEEDEPEHAEDADWNEGDHPRSSNGQFGSSGGSNEGGKKEKKGERGEIHREGSFSVRHDPVRKKKGLPSYAVFKDDDARGLSQHHSREEAINAAKKHAGVAGDRIAADERLAFDASVRSYDKDGHLHVTRTPISKANVCPYWGYEIPGAEELGLDPDKQYQMLRHPDELRKAAARSNGKQLLIKHVPVSPDDSRKWDTVGSIGDKAEFEDPYLYNSLHVWDRDGLDAIEDEDQKELSSAYHYTPVMKPGIFKGVPYDGVMTNIHFNHVALVKEGRAGADVLVADSQISPTPKENCSMSKKVLSRFAGASAVAMGFYLKPKLAADAKIDLTPIFDGVSKKNFPEKQAKIAQDIKAAVKGKLAKDASLEDLTGMLDHLKGAEVEEGVDADPNSGLPMSAEEMKAKMGKTEDEDPKEKLRQFLSGKLSAEDLKACDDIMGMSGAEDEESEEAKKDAEGENKDDHEVKDGKPEGVDKKAMDAAIKLAMDSTETRVRKQFAAAAEAREFVRPWAGSLSMALDSAETIYRAALDSLGVKHKGIHPDALRPILEAQPKPGSRKMAADATLAEDSAPGAVSSGFASRWGEAADRIGHNA